MFSILDRRAVLKGAGLLVAGGTLRPAMGVPVFGGHLKVAGAVGSASETLDPARQSM